MLTKHHFSSSHPLKERLGEAVLTEGIVRPGHLFDAVPVGLGQVEAAGGGARLVAHHTQLGHGGEALGPHRHLVLPRVQQAPVVPAGCFREPNKKVQIYSAIVLLSLRKRSSATWEFFSFSFLEGSELKVKILNLICQNTDFKLRTIG